MKRVAWFHCFAGIAGDMALASLIDAGADLNEVVKGLKGLPVEGWNIEAETVMRSGLGATHLIVEAHNDGIVRTYPNIASMIETSSLPGRVRSRALATFGKLAEVEGRLHRRPPAQVHFHEVGGMDAIIDIVGTSIALEILDVDEVYASPVATGTGMVRAAHGLLPNPSPAAVELLKDAPTFGRATSIELTTPTGAALLAGNVVAFGPMPAMTIESTGFGAGTADIEGLPNMTQVVIGQMAAEPWAGGQPLILLEANVDDISGEVLAHSLQALLDAGALDAWTTSALMKKGRPGHVVSALCDLALADALADVMAKQTGTFGVRRTETTRFASTRRFESVDIDGLPVRIKVGPGRIKAENDDVALVARRTGRPLREVAQRAEATWYAQHNQNADLTTGYLLDSPDTRHGHEPHDED